MKQLVTLGTILLGIALIGLGIHVLWPNIASKGYGIPLEGANPGYLIATGARDAVLGLMALALLWRHRPALPLFLSCLILLPLADVVIVLAHGNGLAGLAPHVLGALGLAVLAGLAWKTEGS